MNTIGLSPYDVALLVLGPLCSVLGSLVHFALIEIHPDRLPPVGSTRILGALDVAGRIKWLFLRCFLGGVLGLVFGLYFVGTLKESPTTVAKLLAFAILLGCAAPKLWLAQEKVLLDRVDELVRRLIERRNQPDLLRERTNEKPQTPSNEPLQPPGSARG